ncbi:MAG: aldehyde dehydrogenase, partial [Deltaproteobacteria bacterium]
MIEVKSYLMGAWVSGERKLELIDPTTEEVIGSVSSERPDLLPVLRNARDVGGPALRARTFAER